MVGQTVTHYKILARLGSGGMGVVYRAEDLKLGRVVALKFLSEKTAASPALLERFSREARAISALNHPNICTIYEIDEFDGQPFIAMEFLEGKSLDQEAAGRVLPAQRIIELGIQLADGLDAAHSKGIVHRDIKPANLFVTTRGDLKILDFGLAKLTEPVAATIGRTEPAQTISAENLTSPGTTIGTIAYMSPEQARGEEIDARSDLFSAGSVLYELASGRPPFSGKTSAIVFEAILNREPAPACELNPSLPAELGRIIEKCFEKDREVRYQHAADLRADLKRLKRDTTSDKRKPTIEKLQEAPAGSVTVSAASGIPGSRPTSSSIVIAAAQKHWIGTTAAILVGLLIVTAAVFGIYEFAHRPRPAPFGQFSVVQETDFGDLEYTALSPDGKYLAFVRGLEKPAESLWIRQLSTKSDTQVLPSFEGRVWDIAFSPDADYIYFRIAVPAARRRDLYRVPIFGGQPQLIVRDIDSNVSFVKGGEELCFQRNAPNPPTFEFVMVDSQTGNERILFHQGRPFPSATGCSPDGRLVALAFDAASTGGVNELRILNVAKGSITTLANLGEGQHFVDSISWLPDGNGLIFSSFTLAGLRAQVWYAAYPSGQLRRITNDLGSYETVRLSRDAKSFTSIKTTESTGFYLWDSEHKGDASLIATIKNPIFFTWSDEHTILFNNSALEPGSADLETSQVKILTSDQRHDIWQPSPCGKDTIVFTGGLQGGSTFGIWKMELRSGTFEEVTHGADDLFPKCVAGGNEIVYADNSNNRNPQLLHVPIAGGKPESIQGPKTTWFDLSPAGDQLIYAHSEQTSGKRDWQLHFISTRTWQEIRSVSLGDIAKDSPLFRLSPDGKRVTYLETDHGIDNVWEKPLDGGPARQLTHFTEMSIGDFHWSPDGKKLGIVRTASTADVVLFIDTAK